MITIEAIGVIGELWRLALVLVIGFITFILREPLKDLLARVKSWKAPIVGEAQFMSAMEATKPDQITKNSSSIQPPAQSDQPDSLGDPEPSNGATGDPIMRMAVAFHLGEFDKAGVIYKEFQSSETDENKKLKAKALYLSQRFSKCGDNDARCALLQLTKNPDAKHDAEYWLGQAYHQLGETESAIAAFDRATDAADDGERKAKAIEAAARALADVGKVEQAASRVLSQINEAQDSILLLPLYKCLADLYKEHNKLLGAIALDKACEITPSDSQLRFQTAYAYSEAGNDHLAMLHYDILVRQSNQHRGGHNNLGVAYARLSLPMRSISEYEIAADNGETSAMSNLAYIYINAGFANDAQNLLKRAREDENVDPNVGEAFAALKRKQEQENESAQNVARNAREQRAVLLRLGEALFKKPTHNPSLSGTWRMPDGVEVSLEQSENRVKGSYKKDNRPFRLIGSITNGAAKVTVERQKGSFFLPIDPPTDPGYEHVGTAYLLLDEGDRFLTRYAAFGELDPVERWERQN